MMFVNTIAILINLYSWLSGVIITAFLAYKGFKKGPFIDMMKKAAYTGICTYLDFQTVTMTRYLLGDSSAASIGFSISLACAVISLVGIYLKSKSGRRKVFNWLEDSTV